MDPKKILQKFGTLLPSGKLVKRILLIAFLVVGLMLSLTLAAAGVGRLADMQYGVNNQALFGPSGSCIPAAAQKYLVLFNAAAARAGNMYGVTVDPKLLIAMAQAESNFDPIAKSPTGNVGLMQISIDKAKGGNPYDPQTNINAGAEYLALGLHKYIDKNGPPFSGSPYSKATLDFMIAGYNAGYGTTDTGSIPPYAETQNHIIKVEANYRAMLDCLKHSPRSNSGTTGSSVGQQIATEAVKHIGDSASIYCSSNPRNACAAFVSAIINPIAHASLGPVVPTNWSSDTSGGIRLVNDPAFALPGHSDGTMSLSDLQPGDYVFYADHGTSWAKNSYSNPHHSGIYVGTYTDPQTGNVIQRAVVQLSSDQEKIVVYNIDSYLQNLNFSMVGVKRY